MIVDLTSVLDRVSAEDLWVERDRYHCTTAGGLSLITLLFDKLIRYGGNVPISLCCW